MANNQTANPWLIDTVMPQAYKGVVFIEDLTWDEQVNANDQLVIKTSNGNIILDTKASGANAYQRTGKIGHVEGFQVTTLTSGRVSVFIK